MQFTTQIKIDDIHSEFLNETSEHIGNLRVKLLNDVLNKCPVNALKKRYIAEYNINARQFNSLLSEIKGIIKSANELKKNRISNLKDRIASLKKKIKSKEKQLKKTPISCGIKSFKSPRQKLKFEIHQKKRKLANLTEKLNELEKEELSISIGTKKMFLSQFHLEENGYQNHDEWKEDWHKKRHNRIFYIGSKDESYGNQNCQLIKNILKIRVIPKLESIYGRYYNIANIIFSYGQEIVSKALEKHQAINYRFVHKDKGWYLFLTTEREAAEITTKKEIGAIGIDLNASHIAWTEVNRHGNPVDFGTILTPIQDCTCEQTKAMLSDALKQIVEHAKLTGKPIVIEELDFSKKKSDLTDQSRKYNRMISNFAYSLFFNLLLSKASREGVQIISKNPAYSSVIGKYKYMQQYGISVHLAASLVLARRGLRFSERPPANYAPYLAEHKYGHVWSFWRKFVKAVSNREIQVDLTMSVRRRVSAFSPLRRNTNSLTGIDCPLTCILT